MASVSQKFRLCILVGLPANLLSHLQSELNAADDQSLVSVRSAHITDTLASFHWLWAPKWIKFKLVVIVYWALHRTAPQYLSDQLSHVADMPSWRWLWSSTFNQLILRPLCLGHSWWTMICFCRSKAVEQSSRWHYICFIIDTVSAKAVSTFISAVISGRYYVACLWLFSPWWSYQLFTLATLEIVM